MPKPTVTTWPNEVDILNDVLMYCQLPLVGGTTLNTIQPQSDAHLAYKLLIKNHRLMLSKGQWFNTLYDVEIGTVGSESYTADLPSYIASAAILGVRNVRPIPGSGDEFTKFLNAHFSTELITLDGEEAETIGRADIIWAVPMTDCPATYTNYLSIKTAYDFTAMIGIPFNVDILDEAEREWQIENAQEEPKRNLFCPEYGN